MVDPYTPSQLGYTLIHDSVIWIVILIFALGFMAGFLVCLLLGILEMTRPYKDKYTRLHRDDG